MEHADVVVIGAGVVGCSVAFHLAQLGAGRIRVFDRGRIGEGTSAQSSGILRTHYSVPQNVELARRSWAVFNHFAQYLDDAEASAGLVRCGYLIAAPQGPLLDPLRQSLAAQRALGIDAQEIDAAQARELLPIASLDDAALIGFEPEAGFADAYLTTTAFARAARRRGVRIDEGCAVQRIVVEGARVAGVDTAQGHVAAPVVVSAQNIWAQELAAALRHPLPLRAERHAVLALAGPAAYTHSMPVFKDLGAPGLLYARSYGGRQMLVSEGTPGQTLAEPDTRQGEVALDRIEAIAAQVAQRFPGWEEAGLASSWTGVYDVTPDWNPVLGPTPALPGLVLAFGFSGHGFKLSPVVGRVLAQAALGLPTEVSLAPYALERFAQGRALVGRYGAGAVS